MVKSFKKSAFSLIELSIVILVVAILIAGVVQSSGLVGKSRIKTARTLTESSPVASIKGLTLWVEPTMVNSFVSEETDDGDMISVWYDLNPQAQHKTYLTPGLNNDDPKTVYTPAITYDEVSPIAGLPAILFSPDDAASDTDVMLTKSEAMQSPDNAFTFCVVYRSSVNSSAQQYLITNGNNSSYGNFRYSFSKLGGVMRLRSTTTGNNYALAVNAIGTKLNCSSYEGIKNGNVGTVKSYVNGEELLSNQNSNGIITPEGKLYIGSWSGKTYPFYGHLSELIMYDRALKIKELRAIEKYLAQKYEIALAG